MSARRGLAELAVFLAAATAGVYGLGEGLNGFFEPGHGSVPWLAVAAVAMMVLAKQMARIQDRWPRRARPGVGRPESVDPTGHAADETPPAGGHAGTTIVAEGQ